MKRLAAILALGAAVASGQALAWGGDGHSAVGAMADQLLAGSRARQRVEALLLPGETLESVANWADCVKGSYCGPQTDEMQAYTAANPGHAAFHYTDVPFQSAHYRDHDVGTAGDDVVQILKQAIAVLQGGDAAAANPHRFTARQALLLITHLVGDIHQPLHVGAAFVGKEGGFVVPVRRGQVDAVRMFDTRGGNNLLLDDVSLSAASAHLIPPPLRKDGAQGHPAEAPAMAATRPFHAYWDTTVVDYALRRAGAGTPREFARIAIASEPEVELNTGDVIGWPYQWADDALAVSRLAYAGATAGTIATRTGRNGAREFVWSLAVPDDYPASSSAVARAQLIKGGYHLAALLQAIWP